MKAFLTGVLTALATAAIGSTLYGRTVVEIELTPRQWEQIYLASIAYSTAPGIGVGAIAYTAVASRDKNPKKLRKQAEAYFRLPTVRNDFTSSTLTDIAAHFINQEGKHQ